MKNKGFTLIELLAVIVILAIIALIATPIILGIIDDARKSSQVRSAQYVVEAVQLAYQTKYSVSGKQPTLSEVNSQLDSNGISNAELSDVTSGEFYILTGDKVVCKVASVGGNLTVECKRTNIAAIDEINATEYESGSDFEDTENYGAITEANSNMALSADETD